MLDSYSIRYREALDRFGLSGDSLALKRDLVALEKDTSRIIRLDRLAGRSVVGLLDLWDNVIVKLDGL